MQAAFPRNLSRNNVTLFRIKMKSARKACKDTSRQEIFKFKEENFAFPSCNTKTVRKCIWDWGCSEATRELQWNLDLTNLYITKSSI